MNSIIAALKAKKYLSLTGLLTGIMLCLSLNAFAVNDAEMDHARAIAAKWYLRYINNSSDYLNDINPSSMSDLESQLKPTELENIKKFKAASTPSNYSSWNKDDLVAYWGATFFKESKSLDPNGQDKAWIKSKVTNSIKNNVTVKSTPVPVAAPAPQPEASLPEEPTPVPEAAAPVPVAPAPAPADPAIAQNNVMADTNQEFGDDEDDFDEEVVVDEETGEEKKSSGTWVYVMILCILVAIVVALVVYASKTMKNQNNKEDGDTFDPGQSSAGKSRSHRSSYSSDRSHVSPYMPKPGMEESPIADDARRREKFAETLAMKSEEIRKLNRKLTDLEADYETLRDENRRLKMELEKQRYRRMHPSERDGISDTGNETTASAPSKNRTIYLGRANAKGLFVRADRHAIEGQSIYKLITSNGISGTFTLVDSPIAEEQILEDPGRWVAGGCFAKDIFDTEGRYRVILEEPGRAVFEDGAWKVDRKARIRYE